MSEGENAVGEHAQELQGYDEESADEEDKKAND